MKGRCIIVFAAALALLAGCSPRPSSSALPVIDLAGNIDCADTGHLSDVFEVEGMLHPQLTDSTLLSFPEICNTGGKEIYLLQQSMDGGRLLVYDFDSGRCISSFDHTGKGPGEYGSIFSAQKNPVSTDWAVYCYNEGKVFNYSQSGAFLNAVDNSTISEMYAVGGGWIATGRREGNSNKVFYRYNADWALSDSVVTGALHHATREGVSIVTKIQPAGDVAYWHENDTLFCIPLTGAIRPVVAFELADKKMPLFDSYETERRERENYLQYFTLATGEYLLVFGVWHERMVIQLYDITDGRLICSSSSSMDNPGLPLEVDGTTLHCAPRGVTSDGCFLFMAAGEELGGLTGDEESNPAILKVKVKR